MSQLELGVEDLARYPFLKEAGDHVRGLGVTIDDLGLSDYSRVVERAKQRILEAARRARVSEDISEAEVEILSFPTALVLVKASGLEHLVSRYSYAEALRAERLLEEEKRAVIAYIFKTLLDVDLIEVVGGGWRERFQFKIPIPEYLRRATQFHKAEWKLINHPVERGYVYLTTHELVRLIREEIRNIIYTRIRSLQVPRLPPSLEAAVKEIIERAPTPIIRRSEIEVSVGKYPPCVSHALELLEKGENVPHYGRFLMTTYLLGIGKTVDDIIALYPKLPDFNERMTRYQVEHIAGLRGGRRRYKVPTCRTLQSHSFCFKIKECDDIKSPIQFGRRPIAKKGERKRRWKKGQ